MANETLQDLAELPIYVINAFTDKPFCGNPAAICLPGFQVIFGVDHHYCQWPMAHGPWGGLLMF